LYHNRLVTPPPCTILMPSLFFRYQVLVACGRWHVAGGMWQVACDA
jgi:hypothetical protein